MFKKGLILFLALLSVSLVAGNAFCQAETAQLYVELITAASVPADSRYTIKFYDKGTQLGNTITLAHAEVQNKDRYFTVAISMDSKVMTKIRAMTEIEDNLVAKIFLDGVVQNFSIRSFSEVAKNDYELSVVIPVGK